MNTVRTARHEDLPGLLNLYVQLNPDNANLPNDNQIRRTWEQILGDPKVHCFVAETSGVLTGTCILVIVPNLTRRVRSFAVIENVVTHKEYRRQGIGSQLIRYALEMAWSDGCYKVMLLSGARRDDAHRFYESLGFSRESKVGFVATPPQS